VRRPLERPSAAAAGYYVTTGIGPDLVDASKTAVRAMIDRLVATRGLAPVEAYELCSVALDLKISEIVDHPNYVVSAFLPNDLFGTWR
jgi:acetamidase/formamidase